MSSTTRAWRLLTNRRSWPLSSETPLESINSDKVAHTTSKIIVYSTILLCISILSGNALLIAGAIVLCAGPVAKECAKFGYFGGPILIKFIQLVAEIGCSTIILRPLRIALTSSMSLNNFSWTYWLLDPALGTICIVLWHGLTEMLMLGLHATYHRRWFTDFDQWLIAQCVTRPFSASDRMIRFMNSKSVIDHVGSTFRVVTSLAALVQPIWLLLRQPSMWSCLWFFANNSIVCLFLVRQTGFTYIISWLYIAIMQLLSTTSLDSLRLDGDLFILSAHRDSAQVTTTSLLSLLAILSSILTSRLLRPDASPSNVGGANLQSAANFVKRFFLRLVRTLELVPGFITIAWTAYKLLDTAGGHDHFRESPSFHVIDALLKTTTQLWSMALLSDRFAWIVFLEGGRPPSARAYFAPWTGPKVYKSWTGLLCCTGVLLTVSTPLFGEFAEGFVALWVLCLVLVFDFTKPRRPTGITIGHGIAALLTSNRDGTWRPVNAEGKTRYQDIRDIIPMELAKSPMSQEIAVCDEEIEVSNMALLHSALIKHPFLKEQLASDLGLKRYTETVMSVLLDYVDKKLDVRSSLKVQEALGLPHGSGDCIHIYLARKDDEGTEIYFDHEFWNPIRRRSIFLPNCASWLREYALDMPSAELKARLSGDNERIVVLEELVQSSELFKHFCRDLLTRSLPVNIADVVLSIPPQDTWIFNVEDRSLSNVIKRYVEDRTSSRWNWWPLEAPRAPLDSGQSRLFWICTCGGKQWMEVRDSDVKWIKATRAYLDDVPAKPHWCRARTSSKVITASLTRPLHRTAAATQQGPSAAATRYSPPASVLSSSSTAGTSTSASASPETNRLDQQPTHQATLQSQQASASTYLGTQWRVLFGVQSGSRQVVPTQICMTDFSPDWKFFRNLKKEYHSRRGRLRLWFSMWQLDYCAVVKYNRLSIKRMTHDMRQLPAHQDYIYTPRSGEPDAQNPPLSAHLFEALYDTCSSPCTKWYPHECSMPPSGQIYTARLPKRARCFLNDQTSPIWGLEAVYAISAVHVLAYHLLIVAGSFGFFGWWVHGHPGDLQNASMAATIAGTALSILWMSSGILTSKGQ